MYVICIIDDSWIYHTVKVYNISSGIFLFNMISFLINHLPCYLNWRWFIKNSKSNVIKLKRTRYIWKYLLHVKTKLVFNSLSFSFNNVIDSLDHGENSSIHLSKRYRFQCSLDSCGIGSKIFSGYLLIQSILTQPKLDNMKDIFDRVQIETSCCNSKFSSANLIPGRSRFHTVLWRITIL